VIPTGRLLQYLVPLLVGGFPMMVIN